MSNLISYFLENHDVLGDFDYKLTDLILKARWSFSTRTDTTRIISDSFIQYWINLNFVKPQLNDSTYMIYSLKASNETAMMIEVFKGLDIIYLAANT